MKCVEGNGVDKLFNVELPNMDQKRDSGALSKRENL